MLNSRWAIYKGQLIFFPLYILFHTVDLLTFDAHYYLSIGPLLLFSITIICYNAPILRNFILRCLFLLHIFLLRFFLLRFSLLRFFLHRHSLFCSSLRIGKLYSWIYMLSKCQIRSPCT